MVTFSKTWPLWKIPFHVHFNLDTSLNWDLCIPVPLIHCVTIANCDDSHSWRGRYWKIAAWFLILECMQSCASLTNIPTVGMVYIISVFPSLSVLLCSGFTCSMFRFYFLLLWLYLRVEWITSQYYLVVIQSVRWFRYSPNWPVVTMTDNLSYSEEKKKTGGVFGKIGRHVSGFFSKNAGKNIGL